MRFFKAKAVAAALTASAAAAVALPAASAFADYGNTAQYQIELSMNIPGHQGGGVWLWIELSSGGSADYSGSDCGHAGQGAAPDSGSATWTDSGGMITITGVFLNGLGYSPTITVSDVYGHYAGTDSSFINLPFFIPSGVGFSQLQVAP